MGQSSHVARWLAGRRCQGQQWAFSDRWSAQFLQLGPDEMAYRPAIGSHFRPFCLPDGRKSAAAYAQNWPIDCSALTDWHFNEPCSFHCFHCLQFQVLVRTFFSRPALGKEICIGLKCICFCWNDDGYILLRSKQSLLPRCLSTFLLAWTAREILSLTLSFLRLTFILR